MIEELTKNVDLKINLELSFKEAKDYYRLHLNQFDDIIKKNNSLILANSILISLIITNSYLLKMVMSSNHFIFFIFFLGVSLLSASLFYSLLSLDKNLLKLPKIENIYTIAKKNSYKNTINALTKEYIKDINFNSNKFHKKSKILNTSVFLLKVGLITLFFLGILFIAQNYIG